MTYKHTKKDLKTQIQLNRLLGLTRWSSVIMENQSLFIYCNQLSDLDSNKSQYWKSSFSSLCRDIKLFLGLSVKGIGDTCLRMYIKALPVLQMPRVSNSISLSPSVLQKMKQTLISDALIPSVVSSLCPHRSTKGFLLHVEFLQRCEQKVLFLMNE